MYDSVAPFRNFKISRCKSLIFLSDISVLPNVYSFLLSDHQLNYNGRYHIFRNKNINSYTKKWYTLINLIVNYGIYIEHICIKMKHFSRLMALKSSWLQLFLLHKEYRDGFFSYSKIRDWTTNLNKLHIRPMLIGNH